MEWHGRDVPVRVEVLPKDGVVWFHYALLNELEVLRDCAEAGSISSNTRRGAGQCAGRQREGADENVQTHLTTANILSNSSSESPIAANKSGRSW